MAMRLDKFLAHAGLGTRSEVKKFIRSGRVLLNGAEAKRPEEQVQRYFWMEKQSQSRNMNIIC